jgi:hypothetical protein
MTFPQELAERRQWICWRLEPSMKGDRPNKTPYSPHSSRRASSIDPTTWGTLEDARRACEKYNYTGLGFVFTNDDDFVGVDIDHCRNKDTGVLNETAAAIISKATTYTEISPSGEGLHLFFHGTIPPGGNKNSKTGVEMYAFGRYFTMTGNRLDNAPLSVQEDSGALAWIHATYIKPSKPEKAAKPKKEKQSPRSRKSKTAPLTDEAVLERALAADKDELFSKLWSGRWEEQYDSQSEADMALCCKLAFWTGKNRDQMDRLLRQSKLYRDKWDERHHASGATYGEETIAKALDLVEDSFSPASNVPVFEFEGRYYRAKGDTVTPLTNFIVKPLEMIESEEETQLTADLVTVRGETFRHSFLTTDFANLQRFKNTLNKRTIALSYTGSEGDLELLKAFLSELDWVRKKGVRASGMYFHGGRWVFVGGDRAADGDGNDVSDIQQFEQYRASGPGILDAKPLAAEQLPELGKLLLSYNEPAKSVAVLAWCAGCFVKEHLKGLKIKYPHLFLIGEAGSGKSNTLERVILPIFSKTRIAAASQVTRFTIIKESTSSNLLPQPLDEFKPSKIDRLTLNVLLNHMRNAYDGTDGERGRADQTSVKYPLTSPLVVAGEESPAEASIRERSIELLFSKKDLKPEAHRTAFIKLSAMPDTLAAFGRSLLDAALNTSAADVESWYKAGLAQFEPELPSRIRNNLACCVVGLRLIERLCLKFGLDWSQVYDIPFDGCVQYLAYGAKEYLLDGGEANKGIIEQTLEGMARMGLTSNQWTIMDRNLDQVAICFKRCYDDYTKYRRDHAIMGECLEYTQFLRQLRASDLFIAYKSVRMAGDTVSAHVLNFDLIRTRCGIQSFDVNAPDFDCPWD